MPVKKKTYLKEHEGGHYVDEEGRVMHPYYEWTAPLFYEHERGALWYIFVILAFSLLAGWFIFKGDFLPAFVIGLLETVVLLHAVEESKEVTIRIDDRGIKVDKNVYRFKDIKTFWLRPMNDEMILQFDLKDKLGRVISVMLDGMNYHMIRGVLSVNCKEDEEKEEDFLSSLGRKLKI